MSTNTLELGLIASSTHSRHGVASPEQQAPKPPKKPAVERRNISLHIPYKGQEFSVDDAEDKVNKNLAQLALKPVKTP